MPTIRSMRTSFVEIPRGPLHLASLDGAGRTLVCLHGLGGAHTDWLGVAPALAEHGRVIAPDLIGFGRTPLAGRSAAVDDQVPAVAALAEQTAEGPVTIIGNSFGGLVAMRLAASRPDLVDELVLISPALPPRRPWVTDTQGSMWVTAYALPGIGRGIVRWRRRRLGALGMARERLEGATARPKRVPAHLRRAFERLQAERQRQPWAAQGHAQAARSMLSFTLRPWWIGPTVRRIDAPALVVQGTEDRMVDPRSSERLAGHRPDWDLTMLDGLAHIPHVEDPTRTAEVISRWFSARP